MSETGKISQEQITEWHDSPVTEYFFSLIKQLEESAKFALQDEPFDVDSSSRYQSRMGNLWGLRSAFGQIYNAYEDRSFVQLEEPESE